MVVITDEEFESVAPEMSGDIELRNFVPLEQIPPIYFNRPYFLAPSGKSAKAYHLLTATMEKTGRVGIGSFVMRGHEYLVAIIADNGVLRADTLRYATRFVRRKPSAWPNAARPTASKVTQFTKAIADLTRTELDLAELRTKKHKHWRNWPRPSRRTTTMSSTDAGWKRPTPKQAVRRSSISWQCSARACRRAQL